MLPCLYSTVSTLMSATAAAASTRNANANASFMGRSPFPECMSGCPAQEAHAIVEASAGQVRPVRIAVDLIFSAPCSGAFKDYDLRDSVALRAVKITSCYCAEFRH